MKKFKLTIEGLMTDEFHDTQGLELLEVIKSGEFAKEFEIEDDVTDIEVTIEFEDL